MEQLSETPSQRQHNKSNEVLLHYYGKLFDPHFQFPLAERKNLIYKRCIDLIISSFFILLVFPWFVLIVAIGIKLSSRGSVFFRQMRHKRNGEVFTCIKFRTMVPNEVADTKAATANDPRITKFGMFLRRHHIDELPQMMNVWWGDMSLIGPRPYMMKDTFRNRKILGDYDLRHKVKPGITGLAQSLGYNGIISDSKHARERFELDLAYIKDWTLKMEIDILYRTILIVAKPKPAALANEI